jgi:hypothetical protein
MGIHKCIKVLYTGLYDLQIHKLITVWSKVSASRSTEVASSPVGTALSPSTDPAETKDKHVINSSFLKRNF